MRAVAVFCGAGSAVPAHYAQAAYRFGQTLARKGLRLVYGGGAQGLMGAVARGAQSERGGILGILPAFLTGPESAETRFGERMVVADMHTRKAQLMAQADAFVALPGGLGTLDELLEVLAWTQLGLIRKPTGLLNTADHFAGLLHWLERAAAEGFVRPAMPRSLLVEADGARLLERLNHAENPDSVL